MAKRLIVSRTAINIPGLQFKNTSNKIYLITTEIDENQNAQTMRAVAVNRRTLDPLEGELQPLIAIRSLDENIFSVASEATLKRLGIFTDPKKANITLNKELNENSTTRNNIDTVVRTATYELNGRALPANDPAIIDLTKAAVINPANADINPPRGQTPPPGDPPGGSATATDFNATIISYIKGYTPPGKFGNLMYPKTLSESQDVLRIDVIEYLPRNLSTKNNFTFDPRYNYNEPIKDVKGSIFLPIQPNISDKNSVNWSEDNINQLELLAAGVSANFQSGGGNSVTALADLIEREQEGPNKRLSTSAKAGLTAFLSRMATGAGNGNMFLSRIKGAIMNPNMELLFSNPNLRSFNFNFKFVPRSQQESEEVIKIIRVLKEYSAVQRGIVDLFLKAPHVFQLRYAISRKKNGDQIDIVDHPGINRMKICALQAISVNYVPDGTYATRSDGAMTAYEVGLSFGELDPIYADDYKNMDYDNNPIIGY